MMVILILDIKPVFYQNQFHLNLTNTEWLWGEKKNDLFFQA